MLFHLPFAFPQGEGDNILINNFGIINFKSNQQYVTTPSLLHNGFIATPLIVSDCNGDVLFYYSQGSIKNGNHSIVENGDTLGSGHLNASWREGSNFSAIKVPGSDSLYYIFSSASLLANPPITTHSNDFKIEYAILNTRANNGLGKLESKQHVLRTSTSDGFTIIRHQNKIWYWFINYDWFSNQLHYYLITNNGITFSHSQSFNIAYSIGQVHAKFYVSAKSDLIAVSSWIGSQQLNLFKFDNRLGLCSNHLVIEAGRFVNNGLFFNSAVFSVNNNYLYLKPFYSHIPGTLPFPGIVQVDLSHWDIDSMYINAVNISSPNHPYHEIVGMYVDGSIYIKVPTDNSSTSNGYHLSRIEQPDLSYPLNSIVDTSFYYPLNLWVSNSNIYPFSRFPGHYYLPDRYGISAENFCWGDTTRFDLNDYDNLGGISWDFGDPASGSNSSNDTAPFHIFSGPGSYTVTAYATYCNRQDTLTKQITITGQPNHSGLKDTTLCAGVTYLAEHAGISGMRYRWWDNDSIPQKNINQRGWYWLETSNACYSRIDSFYVNFEQPPQTGLPTDTSLCAGDVLYLAPQPGNYRWHWNDGDSLPKTITQAGQYILIANNSCGSFPFTVQVHERQPPQFNTPPDTTLCEGQVIRVELDEQYQTNYQWQDGSTERIRLLSDSGFYSVTGSNPCGNSSGSFSIQTEDCACNIYIPNAFTPNGDGLNEVFKLESRCEMQQFELSIYNRWGEKVFQSQQLNHYWDGRIQGKPAPPGNYVYVLFYHREGLGPRRTSGHVLVQY